MLNADDLSDVRITIPLGMLNRHGLVAGATGTGKTKTLQLLAEQLSANGVPVFAADIKGDLSGLSVPGEPSDKLTARTASVGQEWTATGFPTEFYAIGGQGVGVPVRVTMTRVRPDPARQGARPQRDAGVLAGPGLLLLRQAGAAAARPRRPARGPAVPHRRRGREGRAQDDRRALAPDRRRDPARAGRVRGPGCRRVLRRAGVRDQGLPAHHRGRPRHHQPARAAQPAGPAGALLDLPDVAARRPLPRPAGGGRPRQAQAGLLLRRGAPALQRRLRRVPRPDRADRAADPVQGRRRLLRDAVAHRRPGRRARPSSARASSTSSAPTPPTTPRPSRRPSTPTPTARTTTSARSSRRSGSARRS